MVVEDGLAGAHFRREWIGWFEVFAVGLKLRDGLAGEERWDGRSKCGLDDSIFDCVRSLLLIVEFGLTERSLDIRRRAGVLVKYEVVKVKWRFEIKFILAWLLLYSISRRLVFICRTLIID